MPPVAEVVAPDTCKLMRRSGWLVRVDRGSRATRASLLISLA
jgi:hypothetical protein